MTTNVIPILHLKLELERKIHKSKSEAQARLMQAVAHNPEFAEKVDIPQEVGSEFVEADKTAQEQLIGKGWIAFPCYDFSRKDDDDGEFYWYVCPKDFYEKTGKVEDGHAFDGIKLKGLEEVADHVLFANNGDDGVKSLKKYGFEIIGYPEEIVGKEKAFKLKKTAHSQAIEPQQAERPEPIHFELNGLPITIENQAGTVRKGTDQAGNDWAVQLKAHYGEIRGSIGADGDYVDCFINPDYMPDEQSIDDPVFVVNQIDPYTGEFDEVKVMIGYDSLEQAKAAYAENYEDGFPEQEIIETNYSDLINWLNGNESTEEFEE